MFGLSVTKPLKTKSNFFVEMHYPKQNSIPNLYETENIPPEKKIIYQKWEIPHIWYYWLISELDRKQNLAFGYANLNDDVFAEWGYISIEELIDNNATLCRNWKPCTFEEAQKLMQQYKRERRS
jgi:hypothetical protein